VVPFGRSFDEYKNVQSLRIKFQMRILGIGDGPASFNAEAKIGCKGNFYRFISLVQRKL